MTMCVYSVVSLFIKCCSDPSHRSSIFYQHCSTLTRMSMASESFQDYYFFSQVHKAVKRNTSCKTVISRWVSGGSFHSILVWYMHSQGIISEKTWIWVFSPRQNNIPVSSPPNSKKMLKKEKLTKESHLNKHSTLQVSHTKTN